MRGPRLPRYGGLVPAITSDVVSRALLHWRPDWAGQDAQTGALLCITDHRLSWSRGGATLAGVATTSGGSYTAAGGQAAWEPRTLFDGSVRLGLRVGAADVLSSVQIPTPQCLSLMVTVISDATPSGTVALLTCSTTSTSDPALLLTMTSTGYRLRYTTNGTAEAYADVARTSADNGKLVELQGVWSDNGGLQLFKRVDGADAAAFGYSAGTLARTTWAANTAWRVGVGYSSLTGLIGWHGGVKVIAGSWPSETVRQIW